MSLVEHTVVRLVLPSVSPVWETRKARSAHPVFFKVTFLAARADAVTYLCSVNETLKLRLLWLVATRGHCRIRGEQFHMRCVESPTVSLGRLLSRVHTQQFAHPCATPVSSCRRNVSSKPHYDTTPWRSGISHRRTTASYCTKNIL